MSCLFFAVALICMAVVGSQADNICAPDGKYLRYYPGDCTKYYKCDNGQVSEGSCGWFYRFDEESDECKLKFWFFSSVDCSKALKPLTPSPEPTTTGTTEKSTPKPSDSTTTKGSTPKPNDVTTTKGSTPKPNDVTTKKNAASSLEISLLLATLCSAALLQRQL